MRYIYFPISVCHREIDMVKVDIYFPIIVCRLVFETRENSIFYILVIRIFVDTHIAITLLSLRRRR